MKKSESSKKDKSKNGITKKVVGIVLGLVAIVVVGFAGLYGYIYYKDVVKASFDQTAVGPIRELVILAMENINREAPVDPKTGDVYFPPSKLFIPYSESSTINLTYRVNPAIDNTPEELVISQKGLGIAESQAYAAKNVEEFFSSVPKMQACQRGLRLYYQEITDRPELQLKTTVNLKSGKTLYIYGEQECTGLDALLIDVKNIQEF